MPKLTSFDTPAGIRDFPGDAVKQAAMSARWSDNINRFTEQTLQNDPWDATNQPALTQYFNPRDTDIPDGAPVVRIPWTAFPRRIISTFPNVGQRKQWEYADNGPDDPKYQPKGPRGWQDEYCEWSVTRNDQGKITRVMFTCENREYWYTLWEIDPQKVLELYRDLVSPAVTLDDLELRDRNGNKVIDPRTGRPAYDDRNKWNNSTTNGAVHLISNPNALSAEIFLGGQATILRKNTDNEPITDKTSLILCSRYGTPGRNSDPTIGASVNALVRQGLRISLNNPVGLYIQTPDFSSFTLPGTAPSGASPADYWTVRRGRVAQDGEALDFILHAVFEVPEDQGFTVGDMMIGGFPIDYAAQITQNFQIALAGVGVPQISVPDELSCAGAAMPGLPRPYVLCAPSMLQPTLRSNLNMRLAPGDQNVPAVLLAFDSDSAATLTVVGDPGVNIVIGRTFAQDGAMYFDLSISVDPLAPLGDRSLLLTNPDGSHGPAVYGLLEVVADPAPQVLTAALSKAEMAAVQAMILLPDGPTRPMRR
ncbi:hypothetical protein [Paracoccus sp. (in: a-proteobacteria)]|uniref:hypothetical protein n=1 Tax=Paracoccus sp. TaxID=267 RepID=UPI003A8771A2